VIRAVASLAVCISVAAYGQPAAALRFDVASIKPSIAEQLKGPSGGKSGKGRLTMNNVTLRRAIMGAYEVGPNQIIGGPNWLNEDRYEIVAKADLPTDDDAILNAMLQTLLAERFKLKLHRETRTISAFVLEVAKNGPRLEKAEGGEPTTSGGHGRLLAKNTTMDRFAEVLSRQMDLPVVNHTGLTGVFNPKLQWNPESAKLDVAASESLPSIFTAMEQQLGLRLRSQKTPVEVLVIDYAEKPSEN
jgi:uncharacterized protein (TIGR03435 family)